MGNLDVVAAQRTAAWETLYDWRDHHPLTLKRPVYFVPGFTDELGRSAWGLGESAAGASFALVVPHVCTNHETHAHFVTFNAERGSGPPHYENFLRFGADLARLIADDVRSSGEKVDILCHSMGGLDTVSAVSMLDDYPQMKISDLDCVNAVIAFDTPFCGFAAANNPVWAALRRMQGRGGPDDQSQARAMCADSLLISDVWVARDKFLERIGGLWPRGADNSGGLIEVPHESASFGNATDIAPAAQSHYRGYKAWDDTTHSGTSGVTRDPRAIVEALQILTAQ